MNSGAEMAGRVSRVRRRYEMAAAVSVLAVFAALYLWAVLAEGSDMWWLAVLFAAPVALWLFAAWLLVHHWWERAGARLSTMDPPQQVLAVAVAALPEPRRSWGEAMLAELAQVRSRPDRWRFALSCVRAALSLPARTGRPALTVAAAVLVGAAATAAYAIVGDAVSGLGFFAAGFTALVGLLGVVAVARSRRVRPHAPAATVLVAAAVAGCVAVVATFLARHPAAAEGLSADRAAVLAVALAGCLWWAVAAPHGGSRLASYVGVGAAVAFAGLGALVTAQLAGREGGPALWLLCGPMLTFLAAGCLAATKGRSFRDGVRAGIWAAITVMPLTLAGGLLSALRQYGTDGAWTFAGDVTTAGATLGFAFLAFLAIPIIGFPFAVMGATTAAMLHGNARRP